MKVAEWVGRSVKIVDGIHDGSIGETGVVLAVDATERPAAWVKVQRGDDWPPAYRSCDLCWLQDIETGEEGPVWNFPPPIGMTNEEFQEWHERCTSPPKGT